MIFKKHFARVSFLGLLLFVHCPAFAGAVTDCPPGCGPGRWSKNAIDLSSGASKAPYGTRDIRISSPDHQKVVRVVKERWWVEIGAEKISPTAGAASILYPAELAWAPDSRALYITRSAGYTTGYNTDIYRLHGSTLQRIMGISGAVQRDFERRHKCSYGQSANVAGLEWTKDSDQLLLVAEVPPVSICRQMDYFGGYLVSLSSGRILERYSPKDIENRWNTVLGERLRGDFEQLSTEQRVTPP